jgi:hypothetical protein
LLPAFESEPERPERGRRARVLPLPAPSRLPWPSSWRFEERWSASRCACSFAISEPLFGRGFLRGKVIGASSRRNSTRLLAVG